MEQQEKDMNFVGRTIFTDVDHALEEAQFLVERDKVPYAIVRVSNKYGAVIHVVPESIVNEIQVLEVFRPVEHGTGT